MRPPRLEDAAAVAALTSAHSPEPFGPVWVEREWTEPGFELEQDARIDDGRAFAGVWSWGTKAWLDLQGEPTPELLAWAEQRAREKGLARAHSGGWSRATAVNGLLEQSGYRLIRKSWRMFVDLADVVEEPSWPDGISVRTFRPGDELVFFDVYHEAFADHWEFEPVPYEEWAHWALQPPMHEPALWFLAEEAGEPAGIAICHRRPELPTRGRVGDLGVRRPWRRRGVGRALLLHAFHEFRRAGLTEADLGVDAENLTGATRLYESVGMNVADHRDIYEKALA
jgi:mycothiol synthase